MSNKRVGLPIVIEGDVVEVLGGFAESSVDAVLCDPPYGLSNQSPQSVADSITRALAKIVLPNLDQLEPSLAKKIDLSGIPLDGSRLSRERLAAIVEAGVGMPEGSVDLESCRNVGEVEIETGDIASQSPSNGVLANEPDTEGGEFFGDYVLDARDALDSTAGDVEGRRLAELGLGSLRVPVVAASLPGRDCPLSRLLLGGSSLRCDDVLLGDDPRGQAKRAPLVLAAGGAVRVAVLCFDTGRSTLELRITNGTHKGAGSMALCRPQLVRTFPRASGLPSVAEPYWVRVVVDGADGANAAHIVLWLTGDVFSHIKPIVSRGGFMGKSWQGR